MARQLKEVTNEEPQVNEGEIPSFIEYSEDISDAERPDPLPVGEYHAKIVDAGIARSKEKGNLYYFANFSIDRDAMPVDYVEKMGPQMEQLTLVHRIMGAADTPQGRFNAKNFCSAIGSPMSNRISPKEEWIGLEAKVKVEHGKDLEGNPRPEIRRVVKL
jgi:hypothetical protein